MNRLSQTVPLQYDTTFSPYAAVGWRAAFADLQQKGFTGVEIAVAYPDRIDADALLSEAQARSLAITTISTGQAFGRDGLYLTEVSGLHAGANPLSGDFSLLAKGFADRRNYQRGGAMLFLSSAAAVHPEKGHCLYGAGKAALAAAMQAVSQEVAPAGLRVHCLAPGLVRTPMLDTSVQNLGESYLSAQEAAYPLGLGRPEDVAFMAAFLLSDKAAWISGQNFVLAGGRY